MRLQLGCFDQPIDGWINTDITPHALIARIPGAAQLLHLVGTISEERIEQHRQGIFRHVRYMNAAKRFPFPDKSFEAIYCAHMLEHLYPQQAEICIIECYRVLQPGGILRLNTPDLDEMIARYQPSEAKSWLVDFFEYGFGMGKNSHRWYYNFQSLSDLLRNSGFGSVKRSSFGVGEYGSCDNLAHRAEGMYVEATR